MILDTSERYTPLFLELGGSDAVTKYSAKAALPMTKPPAAQHLDPWQHDEIFQGAEFTTLRKAAKHPKAVFDNILEEFLETAAKKSIMVAMKTNLKGVERGTAKAQAKFGGDVTGCLPGRDISGNPAHDNFCELTEAWTHIWSARHGYAATEYPESFRGARVATQQPGLNSFHET